MAYLDRPAEATATPFAPAISEAGTVPASAAGAWKARTFQDYTKLETAWRHIEADGHCTVFQTYDWVSCWYDSAAACGDAEPLVVVVSKEDAGPAWILPLCIYREKGMRVISFADCGISDYAAPAMARGAPTDRRTVEAMIRAIFKALPPCDVVSFEKLVERVEGMPNPLALLRGQEKFPVGCHGIRLTEPWPVLAEKIMQRRLRGTIRREKKKLDAKGEVAIEHREAAETLRPHINRLLEMRRERFESIGRSDMPPLWKTFYRNLAVRKARAFDAGITTMTVSGEVVATCFGLTRGNTFVALLPTFQMGEWESHRPGQILFDHMLTSFGERTNHQGYFDFTVGDEVYKQRFGCERRDMYEWMAPRSAAGLLAYAAWRAKAWLRRHPRLLAFAKDVRQKITR